MFKVSLLYKNINKFFLQYLLRRPY